MKRLIIAALTLLALVASPALAVDIDAAPTVAPMSHSTTHKPAVQRRTRHAVHVAKHTRVRHGVRRKVVRRARHPYRHYSTGPASGRHYRNVNGRSVHSPMHARRAPAGASAQCNDGTYSFSQHHRGTCSRHGGVRTWL
jgi:hypothetical protein